MIKKDKLSNIAQKIAKALIKIKAVVLKPEDPFTWASGWKSPIYCDNRKTLSFPEEREVISNELVALIKRDFPQTNLIAGVATAGIPQASIIADRLGLPLVYVRDKSKSHGMENQIEGTVNGGEKCVLIEDLISTGGSSIKAAKSLSSSGVEVLCLLSTFTYGFPQAEENFNEAGYDFVSLCSYEELIPLALEEGIIKVEQLELLQNWRKDPGTWVP